METLDKSSLPLAEERQGEVLSKGSATREGDKRLYIESYGCQMNFSDSEIVASILSGAGYATTRDLEEADLVLLNTCSIRDKAEQTVRKRLQFFNQVINAGVALVRQ